MLVIARKHSKKNSIKRVKTCKNVVINSKNKKKNKTRKYHKTVKKYKRKIKFNGGMDYGSDDELINYTTVPPPPTHTQTLSPSRLNIPRPYRPEQHPLPLQHIQQYVQNHHNQISPLQIIRRSQNPHSQQFVNNEPEPEPIRRVNPRYFIEDLEKETESFAKSA